MDNFKELIKEHTGKELNSNQLNQFLKLAEFLIETNKITNLTAIRNIEDVYLKHFIDSLTLIKSIPENTKSILDIGSGAGFPGLPLAIAMPEIKVTMIESIGKKANFIKNAIELLNIENAEIINERAEKICTEKTLNGKFDLVTARAVTFLPELIKLCKPFMKQTGIMVAMKNENKEELESSERILIGEGLKIEKIIPIQIPKLNPRQLIIINKK